MNLPTPIMNVLKDGRDRIDLRKITRIPCQTGVLRDLDHAWLYQSLADASVSEEWPAVAKELGDLGITESANGVNMGDRRAIYTMVRALKPTRVLEVGTHIGASTVHIAAALRANGAPDSTIATVDIEDVNDPYRKPWIGYGSRHSPAELVSSVGLGDRVNFITRPSLDYLSTSDEKFDLIFLDGDHHADTVYQELPAAIRLLHPQGVVLLHDFFPYCHPLWPDRNVIPGPWLATERLRKEGAALRVLPLGALPWLTKQGTNVTSLAIAARA